MILLAIDTTSRPGSAAVMRNHVVLAERAGDPARSAGERLPAEIQSLLGECGLTIADVNVFAVASGPGSFTGLRVGIATVQGLALANQRPVVAVSALEALAFQAKLERTSNVAAWIDAQRGEVFAALYGASGGSRDSLDPSAGLAELGPPVVGRPQEVLGRWQQGGALERADTVFVGSGAVAYADVIRSALGTAAEVCSAIPLLAAAVARIADVRAAAGGAVAPHAITPVYVRRPDAELARERRDGRG